MFDREAIASIKKILTGRKETIAVAESVTAGLLQNALASAEEASNFFQGGITCYNIGQKCRHLNIDPIYALSCNCVSDRMAREMALQCIRSFTANWSISVTGYASPMPESCDQLFAHYAIAHNGEIRLSEKIETEQQPPDEIQLLYVNTILKSLHGLLAGE